MAKQLGLSIYCMLANVEVETEEKGASGVFYKKVTIHPRIVKVVKNIIGSAIVAADTELSAMPKGT